MLEKVKDAAKQMISSDPLFFVMASAGLGVIVGATAYDFAIARLFGGHIVGGSVNDVFPILMKNEATAALISKKLPNATKAKIVFLK